MKIITIKNLSIKFQTKFKTENKFKIWWYKERKKLISQGYPNKPIMKLICDQQILTKLMKQLKLDNVQFTESTDFPSPIFGLEKVVRFYLPVLWIKESSSEN